MKITGTIFAVLPLRTGTSANGEWASQDYVLETFGQYSRKVVFNVYGQEKIQRFNIQVGQVVDVDFDISAREYNGRWYNSINAFSVMPAQPAQAPQPATQPYAMPQQPQQPMMQPNPFGGAPVSEDLPF